MRSKTPFFFDQKHPNTQPTKLPMVSYVINTVQDLINPLLVGKMDAV